MGTETKKVIDNELQTEPTAFKFKASSAGFNFFKTDIL